MPLWCCAEVTLVPRATLYDSASVAGGCADLKMKDGSAALPPVNESQASTAQGALSQGHAKNPSAQAGNGPPAAKPGLGDGPWHCQSVRPL